MSKTAERSDSVVFFGGYVNTKWSFSSEKKSGGSGPSVFSEMLTRKIAGLRLSVASCWAGWEGGEGVTRVAGWVAVIYK